MLMQVVFHTDIEKDAGRFTMDDVCDSVVKKLLFRHPHVFGDGRAETADTVPASWDELKRQEKGQKTTADALDAVARSLPACGGRRRYRRRPRTRASTGAMSPARWTSWTRRRASCVRPWRQAATWPVSWAMCCSPP